MSAKLAPQKLSVSVLNFKKTSKMQNEEKSDLELGSRISEGSGPGGRPGMLKRKPSIVGHSISGTLTQDLLDSVDGESLEDSGREKEWFGGGRFLDRASYFRQSLGEFNMVTRYPATARLRAMMGFFYIFISLPFLQAGTARRNIQHACSLQFLVI